MSDRVKRTAETFRDIFGTEPTGEDHPDFELMQILQRQIFGEIFHRAHWTSRPENSSLWWPSRPWATIPR